MSNTTWRGQIYRAVQAIDCLGHSKYEAKQAQGWHHGQPVHGLYRYGYKNLVFDRAITYTNWLHDQYLHIRLFRDVDREMTTEYLNEKSRNLHARCAVHNLSDPKEIAGRTVRNELDQH
jgi:hypothetical protein